MRSTRRDENEGLCTTNAMPAELIERVAKQEGVGVTVIARGRVDLSPGRDDMAVLREIREIGGEQYLYDFAQYTKRGWTSRGCRRRRRFSSATRTRRGDDAGTIESKI